MKRTEKKLKEKGYKALEHYSLKYDRSFVARHYGDATHVPFSRGCVDEWYKSRPNERVWKYLKGFFRKQAGKKLDVVYHNFCQLGWKTTFEREYFWEYFIVGGYYMDEYLYPFLMRQVGKKIDDVYEEFCQLGWKSTYIMNDHWESFIKYGIFRLSDDGVLLLEENASTTNKDDSEEKATKRRASSSRLTREQLEHNEREKRRFARESKNHQPSEKYAELVGSFYIEYGHKVILCPVYYRIVSPQTPAFNDVCWETRDDAYWKTRGNGRHRLFIPAKIVGKYREELIFEPYRLVPQNPHNRGTIRMENPDEETLHGCGILIPRIEKRKAKQLLEKATT